MLLSQKSDGTAGTASPTARRFANGATATRTSSTTSWVSAFVAQPNSAESICKEIIKIFRIRGGFESLNDRGVLRLRLRRAWSGARSAGER